jgi:hypothetical protein
MKLAGCIHKPRRDLSKVLPSTRLAKTWRTPIEKAIGPKDPQYQWLHDIADAAAPEVRQRFLDAIASIRGTVKESALRAALDTGSIDQVMHVLGLDRGLDPINQVMAPFSGIVQNAAVAALDATPAIAAVGGALSMRFDMINPRTVQAVRTYGFNLIQQVSNDTRDGIRAVVSNALEFGGHPYDQAREIRNLIGLTDSQANAVTSFRDLLESGDRDALTRALRDRRFDSTLDDALGTAAENTLEPEQIDRMVTAYASRSLNMRAETIARTETLRAANMGAQQAWVQASENGLLVQADIMQGWGVADDDRLCIYCQNIPELNPGGVAIGDVFQTDLGPVDMPPLHPNCRCFLYLLDF